MATILRGLTIYFILLILFRIAGKRSLAEATTFDFVLLLIISEAIQQAMLGNDFSMTNAFLLVITLITVDIVISLLKQRLPWLEKIIDSTPLIIVENGKMIQERCQKARMDEGDILSKARELHGLERMDQIKYAVLERSGGITIIPREQ
jgi:uncharacterized membrane protein YcaP (DUF421 family)